MKWPSLIAKKTRESYAFTKEKSLVGLAPGFWHCRYSWKFFYFLNIFSLGANPTKFVFYMYLLTFYLFIFLLLSLTVS